MDRHEHRSHGNGRFDVPVCLKEDKETRENASPHGTHHNSGAGLLQQTCSFHIEKEINHVIRT